MVVFSHWKSLDFGFHLPKFEITLSQPQENPDFKNPDSGFCHSLSNNIHTAKTVNVVKSKAVGVISSIKATNYG